MRATRFPFPTLRREGAKVQILHRIGLCAVAHVTPPEPAPAYYACAFRQFRADAATRAGIPEALAELRRQDQAEVQREGETLTAAEALAQLDLTPACLESFCLAVGLNPAHAYTRREVRRAIVATRPPKMGHYLSLLANLTPTNPASK